LLVDALTIYKFPSRYRLYLCKPNKEIISILEEAYNIVYSPNLVNCDDLTFTIPYLIDGEVNPNFDLIRGHYLIFMEQILEEDNTVLLQKYFLIIKPNKQGDNQDILEIECKSLEKQLTKILRNFKGVKKLYRTSAEIAAYVASETYPTLQSFIESGILNVVISRCPSWSIGDIDTDLNNIYRNIDVDSQAVLDFLLNTCQKSFNAIFLFDTINKSISVKKLSSVGINKGLFISEENYIKQFGENADFSEICTRLYCYGKDSLSINAINPTGTSYIQSFSYYKSTTYMSQSLIDALNAYDTLLTSKNTEFQTLLTSLNTYTSQLATKNDELDVLEAALTVLNDTKDGYIQQDSQGTIPTYSGSTSYIVGNVVKYNNLFYKCILASIGNLPTNITYWSSINAQITAKETEITTKNTEITTTQGNIDTTNTSITTLRNTISLSSNFTVAQISELDNFVHERDFNDTNYIDPTELRDAGIEVLARINTPPIELNLEIVDFLNIVECQQDWNKLKIGDIINIQYSKFNMNVELRLIGYVHNWEENSLQLTFSNKSRLNDPNMIWEELLQNSVTTSTSIDINKFTYGQYVDSGEQSQLLSYISSELDLAAQKAKAGTNQNIEISKRGITLTNTTSDLRQLRLLNDLLVFSTDGGQTVKLAISPDGVVAENVYGKLGAFATVVADQIVVGDAGEKIADGVINSATTWNNSVQRDTYYNRVKISTTGGIQVFDNQVTPVERIQIGNYATDKYGIRIKNAAGTATVLDQDGIIQSWGDSYADNVDATHKLKVKFYVPTETLSVKKVLLNFSLEAFRSYETGASSGGGQTSSSGGSGTYSTTDETGLGYGGYTDNASATSPHNHWFDFSLSNHSHNVTLSSHSHTVSDHTHNLTFGIYEGTSATGVKVYVDGTLRLDNGGAGYTTDQASLDLSSWITTTGWHYIELSSTQLGRINCAYFMQVFLGV